MEIAGDAPTLACHHATPFALLKLKKDLKPKQRAT
jgi:hypothetical protein